MNGTFRNRGIFNIVLVDECHRVEVWNQLSHCSKSRSIVGESSKVI